MKSLTLCVLLAVFPWGYASARAERPVPVRKSLSSKRYECLRGHIIETTRYLRRCPFDGSTVYLLR